MIPNINRTAYSFIVTFVRCSFAVILLSVLLMGRVSAQTTKPTDGSTPLGLQSGAPNGSYPMSGFDNVNLYNGALNFSLPLLSIGGRGGAGHTILLPIERHWMAEHFEDDQENYTNYPIDEREEELKVAYSPGVMAARFGGSRITHPCPPPPPGQPNLGSRYQYTITRLSFTTDDGTETIFEDTLTSGQRYSTSYQCPDTGVGFDRGKVFASIDGSGATFISDADIYDQMLVGGTPEYYGISGYMMLRDGTRYRIDNSLVRWIRDRNGNKITFTYNGYNQLIAITDSLNRQVTIAYDVNEGGQYGVCDKITYKGFGGAQRVIRISKTTLSNVLRSGYSLTTPAYLFPGLQGSNYTSYNPTVISAVWLPDSDGIMRRYQFFYNNYAELARVVLPTGGAYEYDYARGTTDGTTEGVVNLYTSITPQIYRRVVERRVYSNGGTGTSYDSRMTYSTPETNTSTLGYVIVEQRDASNNLLASSKHYFLGPGGGQTLFQDPTTLPPQTDGREYQTDSLDTNGTTVLRSTAHTWVAGSTFDQGPYVSQTLTTLEPSGANLVAKQTFSFDRYNNQTDVYEYDYGAGTPGALVRHSHTDYLTTNSVNGSDYACNPASTCSASANLSNVIHIRSLPVEQQVFDATGNEKARATFEYDNYASDGSHAPLTDRSLISGLDAAFTTSYQTRGNLTKAISWVLSTSTPINSYPQYDIAGNVVETIDARGIATTYDFTDRFGSPDGDARSNSAPVELGSQSSYALATKATNALGHTAYTQFDYYLGRPVDGEDANGFVASGYYNDVLDRPTQVRRAVGTSLVNQTSFSYDDVNHVVTTTSDQSSNNDNVLVSKSLYDDLGRTTESRQYEGGTNYIATKRNYDALGRAYQISNPYRPWQSESPVWMTTAYDVLGRTVSATTADGATVTTSYYGNQVTATDQAGKKRSSVTDALGRLTSVMEDPNGLAYQTTYSYDVLGNLSVVTQGAQHRYFMYDSLSRLIRARNPEQDANANLALSDPVSGNSQWSLACNYDADGNPSTRTDARGVTASYTYDNLNRATIVSYSDGSSINRYYDSATNGRGRLYASYSYPTTGANSVTVVDSYDTLGRPTAQHQQFYASGSWSAAYSTQQSYDLAGHVLSETYPSGRVVNYVFDAAGRTSAVTGNLGDNVTRTYAGSISYDDWSGISREQFGTDTPLYHKEHRNIRGQLYDMRLSTVNDDSNWNRGAIVNYYSFQPYSFGTSGPDNNGNLLIQQSWVPGDDAISSYNMMQQNYGYDSLNRLNWLGEYQNAATLTGSQSYTYDRYGNRTLSGWGTGINNQSFAVDTNTNRLGVPSGQSGAMQYDANGNLTNDTYSGAGTRTYDAENRIVSATNNSNQQSVYTYDADGRRVRRNNSGQEVWQVYGLSGEMLSEYAANAAATTPQKEYAYRNGELLVTATVTGNWGAAPVLHDNPLVVGQTTIQSRHITELRSAIDTLRTHLGLAAYSWQTSAAPGDLITASPILELRTALDQALGAPSGGHSAGLAQGQPIKAIHIQELRDRVLGAWNNGAGGVDLRWLVSDQLGTPRMIADKSGSLAKISRHDYLPFGEELYAGSGGRMTSQGYQSTDGVREQFTGYERDTETGLDYAHARYFSNTQGRFTSPDPFGGSMTVANPQSLNRYSYVTNNPVNGVDPSGMSSHAPMMSAPTSRYGMNVTGSSFTELADAEAEYAARLGATYAAIESNQPLDEATDAHEEEHADEAAEMAAGNPMLTGDSQQQQDIGQQIINEIGPPPQMATVAGVPVFSNDQRFNCMAWALGYYDRWIQPGPDGNGIQTIYNKGKSNERQEITDPEFRVTPGSLPALMGARSSSEGATCKAGRVKIVVFEDSGNATNWHVERQRSDSGHWTSKFGNDALVEHISNPRANYNLNYPPQGKVRETYYCVRDPGGN